jgi:quercetin dioxygenase-like cupin family protein
MPIDITRFGVGNRRAGSPGTHGVASQVIHSDARGTVAELAMERDAAIEPHTSPNSTWFIVIEGGGWVLVGDEKTRIAAGEAAYWPAGQIHGAWTEHSQLRAFMVELAGVDDGEVRGILEGVAYVPHPALPPASRGEGQLAPRNDPAQHDPTAGEPL